ncbi:hypothetical protein D9M70_210610 [compost metagenome]
MIHGAPQQPFLDREPHAQVFDLQQWRPHGVLRWPAGRLGAEQFPGVGMLWCVEQLITRRLFDDATALHDTYAMRNSPNQVQVVADKQQRHAQSGLQFLEQLKDFQLHGDVQRRSGFVGDQQLRLVGQRHGDHHPLPLSAGKLVGIGLQPLVRVRNADQLQQVQGALGGGLAGQALVQGEHLVDLLFDAVQRVQ